MTAPKFILVGTKVRQDQWSSLVSGGNTWLVCYGNTRKVLGRKSIGQKYLYSIGQKCSYGIGEKYSHLSSIEAACPLFLLQPCQPNLRGNTLNIWKCQIVIIASSHRFYNQKYKSFFFDSLIFGRAKKDRKAVFRQNRRSVENLRNESLDGFQPGKS